MVKLPPRTRMELLHSNVWWFDIVELLKNGFTYPQGLNIYRKGIKCVGDIWDSGENDFFTLEQTREKFQLTYSEEGEWAELTNKICDK